MQVSFQEVFMRNFKNARLWTALQRGWLGSSVLDNLHFIVL